MSEENLDLVNEFPALKEVIHELKMHNSHFRHLKERYHDLNKAIYRAEKRIDVLSEREEESLSKERLHLKDELYSIMSKHKA